MDPVFSFCNIFRNHSHLSRPGKYYCKNNLFTFSSTLAALLFRIYDRSAIFVKTKKSKWVLKSCAVNDIAFTNYIWMESQSTEQLERHIYWQEAPLFMVIFQRCSLYIIDCTKIFQNGERLRYIMPGVERINNDRSAALASICGCIYGSFVTQEITWVAFDSYHKYIHNC